MAYQSLIRNGLNLAFKQAKDLAVTATIARKASPAFDFGAEATTIADAEVVTAKLIELEVSKPSKDTNLVKKTVLFKTSDVIDMSRYDTIVYSGTSWLLDEVVYANKYLFVVTLTREAPHGEI